MALLETMVHVAVETLHPGRKGHWAEGSFGSEGHRPHREEVERPQTDEHRSHADGEQRGDPPRRTTSWLRLASDAPDDRRHGQRDEAQGRHLGGRGSGQRETDRRAPQSAWLLDEPHDRPQDHARQSRRPRVEGREGPVGQHRRGEAPERMGRETDTGAEAEGHPPQQQAGDDHGGDRGESNGEEEASEIGTAPPRGHDHDCFAPRRRNALDPGSGETHRHGERPLRQDGRAPAGGESPVGPEGRRRGEVEGLVEGIRLVPGGGRQQRRLDQREEQRGDSPRMRN